jgi:hypothetical protein
LRLFAPPGAVPHLRFLSIKQVPQYYHAELEPHLVELQFRFAAAPRKFVRRYIFYPKSTKQELHHYFLFDGKSIFAQADAAGDFRVYGAKAILHIGQAHAIAKVNQRH